MVGCWWLHKQKTNEAICIPYYCHLSLHATMSLSYEEGHRAKCEPLTLDQKTSQNKPLFFIKSLCRFVILRESRWIQWVCITDEEFQHQGLKSFHNVIEANIPFSLSESNIFIKLQKISFTWQEKLCIFKSDWFYRYA